ncbi:DNA repair protein RecN [Lutibaculum baratangense]|uniref:DNA repair protein RecN n=1 Tax=Lutibaculum baratangense AMV1 TaxID=631454 RepID=V4R5T9_9HYPH|nr:DNA repair protein RecN [Lutibaculum baratangense]ESR27322.1 DNA repair protein RecN [Lutibaculum baratangense AMV1]
MLSTLSIRDIVIIDRLDIHFTPGLSALTGETGAGKSILLDSFSLALGGRGDAGLVRRGADQGQVTALFELEPHHPARSVLQEAGFDAEGELILRRIQSADGRTRGFVNDQPASAQMMRRVGAALVEIHGQHADRALVDPTEHRRLLDAFAGLEPDVAEIGRLWREWRSLREAHEEAREALEKAASEREYLEHAVEELDQLGPEPGEEERLADRRQVMMHSEKLVGELNEANEIVGGHASPGPVVAAALRRLERRAGDLPQLLEPVVAALERLYNQIDEAQQAIEHALSEAAFDPRELEATEERLFALRAAARKHQVQVDDLAALRERLRSQLQEIDTGGQRLEALEASLADAKRAYDAAASRLSEARRAAATQLDEAVAHELPPLRLERARFETRVDTDGRPGAEGLDRVEFWVQTNPGTHPGPLLKVASGGELSRFLLALKVALADRGSAPTLVFDEIDVAVGGAVADAIGARLARLAERVQVLSVTHAPQVAARASRHLLIRKDGDADTVSTRVEPLEGPARREEIARMLSGATITDEARAAAERLMKAGG